MHNCQLEGIGGQNWVKCGPHSYWLTPYSDNGTLGCEILCNAGVVMRWVLEENCIGMKESYRYQVYTSEEEELKVQS